MAGPYDSMEELFVCFADDVKRAYAAALEAHGGTA